MRAVVVVGLLGACGSSKATIDASSPARPRLDDLDDGDIATLIKTGYGQEVLTLRNLETFSSQVGRADDCPHIDVTGNVVTIGQPGTTCSRTIPPPALYEEVVFGSATITNSLEWPGLTPDASASTVYRSDGLTFRILHLGVVDFGDLDGTLDVSPRGLWTGDITYVPSTPQPAPMQIRVQWTCDPQQTHCDPAGTEIVWKGSGSIAVTGSLRWSGILGQPGTRPELGEIVLEGEDRLEATWSGTPNEPLTWSLGSRTGIVSMPDTLGFSWND